MSMNKCIQFQKYMAMSLESWTYYESGSLFFVEPICQWLFLRGTDQQGIEWSGNNWQCVLPNTVVRQQQTKFSKYFFQISYSQLKDFTYSIKLMFSLFNLLTPYGTWFTNSRMSSNILTEMNLEVSCGILYINILLWSGPIQNVPNSQNAFFVLYAYNVYSINICSISICGIINRCQTVP